MITGCRGLDSVLGNSRMALFYGPAASGKTSLLLSILYRACKHGSCLFISTEGSLYQERIARLEGLPGSVYFLDIYSFNDLLDFTVSNLYYLPIDNLFIDSVNSLYRVNAYEESSIEKFGLILGFLRLKSIRGSIIYASAQVRAGYEEVDEEVTASGMNIMDYWFDAVFRLGRDEKGRFIEPVKPVVSGDRWYFEIVDRGVEWLDGCIV